MEVGGRKRNPILHGSSLAELGYSKKERKRPAMSSVHLAVCIRKTEAKKFKNEQTTLVCFLAWKSYSQSSSAAPPPPLWVHRALSINLNYKAEKENMFERSNRVKMGGREE